MAVKKQIRVVCQACGAVHNKWQGQCQGCEAWNTLVEEEQLPASVARVTGYTGQASTLMALGDVALKAMPRCPTGLVELDHVMGGGLVPGSVLLLGGDPGVGKSTLLLQVLSHLSSNDQSVLYVTGEESPQQVAMRAQRLQCAYEQLPLLAETSVEKLLAQLQQTQPAVVVIDSIQTIFSEQLSAAPGSVSQVRDCAAALVRFAKRSQVTVILVGHVTKDGALAGPRVLEHMVDTVLYFEGQTDSRYRAIRAVKNRFGAVNALGVFAMTDTGLRAVGNPSAIFLSRGEQAVPGSSVMVTWEGNRPLLVEVQALLDDTQLANPRRITVGLDHNRLSLLLAVLHRHGGIASLGQDVFVNVVGGLRVHETAADLPVMMAVVSSLRHRALALDQLSFGEVGLSGEIRPVPSGQARLEEAVKQGFKRVILPKANMPKRAPTDVTLVPVLHLQDVLDAMA